MSPRPGFLADTSAMVRILREPTLLARWEEPIGAGLIASCATSPTTWPPPWTQTRQGSGSAGSRSAGRYRRTRTG